MLLICVQSSHATLTVFEVQLEHIDPENPITVEIFMEPMDKHLSLPEDERNNPDRIRRDAANRALPATQRTFRLDNLVLPPTPNVAVTPHEIDCATFQALYNFNLVEPTLILSEEGDPFVYTVMAIYTDNIPRSDVLDQLPTIPFFATDSLGGFMFFAEDFDPQSPPPTATPTATPKPTGFSFVVVTDADPITELPSDPSVELIEIEWFSNDADPFATIELFYDRDNMIQILTEGGTLIQNIETNAGNNGPFILTNKEQIVNNGDQGIEWDVIDLTTDTRFLPRNPVPGPNPGPDPETGVIDGEDVPNSTFDWNFSDIPGGRIFIYGILTNPDGNRILDYAPVPVQALLAHWPVQIRVGGSDRIVQGVAIDDLVTNASELDTAAVSQSGLLRVYDHLGHSWPAFDNDLMVTVQTAPAIADLDSDEVPEILLGTAQVRSDENPIFSMQNALLMIDPPFKPRYKTLLANLEAMQTSGALNAAPNPQALIVQEVATAGLTNAIHFLPAGQTVFSTPAIRDLDGGGGVEVVTVTRPMDTNGDSYVETVRFSGDAEAAPTTIASFTAEGSLGGPSIGELNAGNAGFEVALGSESGKVFVFGPLSGSVGTSILDIGKPAMRSPALLDTNGDGTEEILLIASQRNRDSGVRTELRYMTATGAPVAPLAATLIYSPTLQYSSLSSPVAAKLSPGAANTVALFTTTNAIIGLDLTIPPGNDPANPQNRLFQFAIDPLASGSFSSSSPVVGQFDSTLIGGVDPFEIIIGGGRDLSGDLLGWSYDSGSGSLIVPEGFADHREPSLGGRPPSILGSPEMADLDGNDRTDIVYTNEGGFINRFEAPESIAFSSPLRPDQFPWPSANHDRARTGSGGGNVVPVAPFLAGDTNRDGVVDRDDLFDVTRTWGMRNPARVRRGASGTIMPVDDEDMMTTPSFLLKVIANMSR